jgi:molybdenum cofactor cytidylyltransferase
MSEGAGLVDSRGRPLDCILLAAGASTRMGRPKLSLPFGSSTILGAAIANALAAGLRVILVARPDDLFALGRAGPRVELAINPEPDRGMLSSLVRGIALSRSERFFFMPADMPFVGPGIYRELAGYAPDSPVLPSFSGKTGHPVLLPSSLIPAILDLAQEVPLKSLIAAADPIYAEVGEDSILRDIDTVEEYARASKRAD